MYMMYMHHVYVLKHNLFSLDNVTIIYVFRDDHRYWITNLYAHTLNMSWLPVVLSVGLRPAGLLPQNICYCLCSVYI